MERCHSKHVVELIVAHYCRTGTLEFKRRLVRILCKSLQASMLKRVPLMPAGWTGIEIQRRMRDMLAPHVKMDREQLKKYNNDVGMIGDL